MISCPHCQAENEDNANVCQRCEQELVAAPADDELPLWLQALKPDDLQGANEAAAAPQAGTDIEEAAAPAPPIAAIATDDADKEQAVEQRQAWPMAETPMQATKDDGGTDTLMETQPAPARRAAPVDAPLATRPQPSPVPPPLQSSTTDTASLISEDDLPAWLRAFSENDTAAKETKAADQSWMTGGNAPADDPLTSTLAQSWQAPARVAAPPRTGAVSVFGVTDEGRTKVTKVEKPAPAPAPEPEPPALPPTVAAQPATPARLGTNRAAAKSAERSGAAMQRLAAIAFLIALVIFLVVLGIFVVRPALMG